MDTEHAEQGYIIPDHLIKSFIDPPVFPLTDREYVGKILYPLRGKVLLNYGCGDGWNAGAFAKAGAIVWAIDISSKAIELSQKKAKANGVEERVTCEVRDAYNTMFPDNFFDVIYGGGILHYLKIEWAAREIKRILKPNGISLFREPIRQTFFMDIVKVLVLKMTKTRRQEVTKSETYLDSHKIRILYKYFNHVDSSFWEALSSANVLIN